MDLNVCLALNDSVPLEGATLYWQLAGNLNLSHTHLDIAYVVHIVS